MTQATHWLLEYPPRPSGWEDALHAALVQRLGPPRALRFPPVSPVRSYVVPGPRMHPALVVIGGVVALVGLGALLAALRPPGATLAPARLRAVAVADPAAQASVARPTAIPVVVSAAPPPPVAPTIAPPVSHNDTAAPPTPIPPPVRVQHTVQSGESLSRIGATYGVSVAALVGANSLTNANLLHVGQTLTIPPADYAIPAWAQAVARQAAPLPPPLPVVVPPLVAVAGVVRPAPPTATAVPFVRPGNDWADAIYTRSASIPAPTATSAPALTCNGVVIGGPFCPAP